MSTVDAVLGRVAALREAIEEGGRRSEELRTCPMDLVDSLRTADLFSLKTPVEAGGLELSFVEQMRVFEEVARLDSNVGWTVIIGNGACGGLGVRISDEAFQKVFSGSKPPLVAAAIAPPAVAVPDGDGYIVSGTLSFASGVRHAEWVGVAGLLADGEGNADVSLGPRLFVVPRDAVEIVDNWNVAGLQGTGSCDVSLEAVRVGRDYVIDIVSGEALRGGPAFRMPFPFFVFNEHISFALGVGRRALDEATELAKGKLRFGSTATVAHRGSFQEQLAYHEISLRSARLLAFDTIERLSDFVEGGGSLQPETAADVAAVATYVTTIAVDICVWAFKVGGAHSLYRSHPLQRCLRDMMAAGNHAIVKDESLDVWGRCLLGMS
jgi:alkylation response protein AidB-like acyl-CoA dehydrogenase